LSKAAPEGRAPPSRSSTGPAPQASIAGEPTSSFQLEELPIVRLADRAGVSRGYIWSVLRGQKAATIDYVAQLVDALGYDPGVLLASKPITRRTPWVKPAPSE
jgi:hypothetical protein